MRGNTKEPPSEPDAAERLRDYDRLKLELASILQTALHSVREDFTPEDKNNGYHRRCRELLAALAEDRFTLAVVGQFNRGKSSLMNAILGLDRLPVGIVPLTSVISKVSYGNPERVLIEYSGTSLDLEIPVEQLAEYVTEAGNPGNTKRVACAEVQLPSEFLRRGLFFVDTPGVGSAITANTATTERFLPEADAVIFVTSFESPLGWEELEFLRNVREDVRKIFFVVNKLDLVPSDQRDIVLNFIRERIRDELGISEPRLFPVSALAGLRAKLAGCESELTESGLPPLEETLVGFLTTERARESLARICDRALFELREPPETAAQQTETFEDLGRRLEGIRRRLLGAPRCEKAISVSARSTVKPAPRQVMQAVRRPCQICTRVAKAMMDFMAKFQYELFVNEIERTAHAGRGGLCPLHTWQYADIASPQGISRSYPPVLMAVSRRLSMLFESDSSDGLAARVRRFLTGPEKCKACQAQAAIEEKIISEILDSTEPSHCQDLSRLPVLCLPHLGALLRKAPDPKFAKALLDFEAATFEWLAENMERYALKHDARRRVSEDERVAYHRSRSQLVGDKRLQAPWRIERLI